jgi:hypothetical protein
MDEAKIAGKRERIGSELLKGLFKEGKLCAFTKEGFRELPRFRTGLFMKILEKAAILRTREGATIEIPPDLRDCP